jgi:hypothetical protein
MTTVTLSERQQAALLALLDLGARAGGHALAAQMRSNGRDTSTSAAHQAANGLDNKRLARKLCAKGAPVRYELTAVGRELALLIRGAR